MSDIKIRVTEKEQGWILEYLIHYSNGVSSLYCTDMLAANLFEIDVPTYRELLTNNGAAGVANYATYFKTKEDALSIVPILDELLFSAQTLKRMMDSKYVLSKRKTVTVFDLEE